MKIMILLLMCAFLTNSAVANSVKLPQFFERTKTDIKNPFEMRDPFKRKSHKLKSNANAASKVGKTVFSNIPTLEGVTLDKLKIVGVILGEQRRAIAKAQDGDDPKKFTTFVIKEGMTMGANNAEVKAILPGGIVLVEKIRNVYDQEE